MNNHPERFRAKFIIANQSIRDLSEIPRVPTPNNQQLRGVHGHLHRPSWSALHPCGRSLLCNPSLDLLGQKTDGRVARARVTQSNRARKSWVRSRPAPDGDAVHAQLGFEIGVSKNACSHGFALVVACNERILDPCRRECRQGQFAVNWQQMDANHKNLYVSSET